MALSTSTPSATTGAEGTVKLAGDLGGTSALPTVTDLTIASEAQGDVLYHNGTGWVRLAAGTSGKFLKTQGAAANPLWDTPAGGGQTLFESIVATSGGDYTTLYDALAAGKTRIFVRNGTYSETTEATVPSDCVIVGESRDNVVIDIDGTANDRLLIGAGSKTDIQISNLTIKSTTATDYVLDQGNNAGDGITNLLLDNVKFDGGGLRFGHTGTASNSIKIQNCVFQGNPTAALIRIAGGQGTTAQGIMIQGCTSSAANAAEAIYIDAAQGKIVIQNNNMYYAGATYGFRLVDTNANGCTDLIITNNLFKFTTTGIHTPDNINTASTLIAGNTLVGSNASYGINNARQDAAITGNRIRGCSVASVNLTATADGSEVTGNRLAGGGVGVGITSACEKVVVVGNNCAGSSAVAQDDNGNKTYIADNLIDVSIAGGGNQIVQYMTNGSGAAVAAGDVVTLKATADGYTFTTTTTAGDDKVYGMALEAINDAAVGRILTAGKTTALKVDGTTDIAIGDFLTCFTTAKIAAKAGTGQMAFAVALEAYTANDSNGVIDALLVKPRYVGGIV